LTRLTRTESTAATREKLLKAAMQVFTRFGFAGTTIESISETAGFSRGAFYAHFSSKENILFALAKAQAEEIAPVFVECINAAESADEAVDAVTNLLVERTGSSGLAFAVMDALKDKPRRGEADEQFVQLITANWVRIGEALCRFFPNGRLPCAPDELVAILVALTYSPVVRGATDYQAKRLVGITLSALMSCKAPSA
jgi:AcrR family transcriptional regulator